MAGVFFGQFCDMMLGTGWPRIYMAGFLTCVGLFLQENSRFCGDLTLSVCF